MALEFEHEIWELDWDDLASELTRPTTTSKQVFVISVALSRIMDYLKGQEREGKGAKDAQ